MITIKQNDFIILLRELGYYTNEEYDTNLQGYFNKYNINVIYFSVGKYYTLSFPTVHKETLFRLTHGHLL